MLKGEIKPLVDDTIPDRIMYEKVQMLNNVSFEFTVQENWYTFVEFYHPDDDGSKQFADEMESIYD